MGNVTKDVNQITRDYLDEILIEERLVDSTLPDIHTDIFGHRFDTPIMTPAFSHLKSFGEGRENGMIEYARAAAASLYLRTAISTRAMTLSRLSPSVPPVYLSVGL